MANVALSAVSLKVRAANKLAQCVSLSKAMLYQVAAHLRGRDDVEGKGRLPKPNTHMPELLRTAAFSSGSAALAPFMLLAVVTTAAALEGLWTARPCRFGICGITFRVTRFKQLCTCRADPVDLRDES
eukprot:s1034_g9.t1